MRRFAAVLALGLGLFVAAHAEAGKLPQGISMVQKMGMFRPSHPVSMKRSAVPRGVDKMGAYRSPHPADVTGR